jgi:hypothetical protein
MMYIVSAIIETIARPASDVRLHVFIAVFSQGMPTTGLTSVNATYLKRLAERGFSLGLDEAVK